MESTPSALFQIDQELHPANALESPIERHRDNTAEMERNNTIPQCHKGASRGRPDPAIAFVFEDVI